MVKLMSKNKLLDLNDHLFAQIERLGDEDTKGSNLAEEIERSKAMSSIAKDIIGNARLVLDGEKYVNKDAHPREINRPAMFQDKPVLISIEGRKK